jgi:hypothetical protein
MPLDIAILDESERPVVRCSVGTREHEALVAAAQGMGAKYLARMYNYYADAEVAVHELHSFREELNSLLGSPLLSVEVAEVVRELESMAVQAMKERRKIVAIAD